MCDRRGVGAKEAGTNIKRGRSSEVQKKLFTGGAQKVPGKPISRAKSPLRGQCHTLLYYCRLEPGYNYWQPAGVHSARRNSLKLVKVALSAS
jgi:hypothetical protein